MHDHATGHIDPSVDYESGRPLPATSLPVGALQLVLSTSLDSIGPDSLPTISARAGPLDQNSRLHGTHLEFRGSGPDESPRIPGDFQGFDHPGRRIRPLGIQDPGSRKRRGAWVGGVPFLPGGRGRLGSVDPHRQDCRPKEDQCGKDAQCEATWHTAESATATAYPRGTDDDLPTGIC